MKQFSGSPQLTPDDPGGRRHAMAFLFPALWSVVVLALLSGCEKPSEPETDMPFPPPPPPAESPAVFVPIPEEFQTPPQETPAPAPPATPRILFIAKEFQITNRSGIQGVQVGETVNLLREMDDEYIVQYGDLEFIKEKSFFSATFVGRQAAAPVAEEPVMAAAGDPASAAPEQAPAPAETVAVQEVEETIGLAAPLPAAEPALPDEAASPLPMPPPQMTVEEKRMAEISDAIRGLNDGIREAQQKLEASGKKPGRAERRALDQMKEQRDELSRQLTTMGKP